MARAFVIHPGDNVATLLENTPADAVTLTGLEGERSVRAFVPIAQAHKIAISPIAEGSPIIKYGQPIGKATREIRIGDWVHLHNCASNLDARSNTLDPHTGTPTDSLYV